jgi:hypothetical protein
LVEAPDWPQEFKDLILKQTMSDDLKIGNDFKVTKV